MPPKFQSSFIPKQSIIPQAAPVQHLDLLALTAKGIFSLSIILALGVIGYRFYLGYSIDRMGMQLEEARQSLAPQLVGELLDLNNRIVSAESLVQNHKVLSPLFAFLEESTPQSVRLTDFTYTLSERGPEVVIRGEARSFAALALESQNIHKNTDLKDPVFSDILLDTRGNVTFLLRALVSPELLSYQRVINKTSITPINTTPISTSTRPTNLRQVSTSTGSTSSPQTRP